MDARLQALALLCTVTLAACASTPEPQDPMLAQQQAPAAKHKCKPADAPRTGSAIMRSNCEGGGPDVVTVDPRDLMDSKRTSVPDPLGRGGR